MIELKAGLRLKGAICTTEVAVVKGPNAAIELTCCGVPMTGLDGDQRLDASAIAEQDTAVILGKRYADDTLAVEVLCTKAGPGPLAANGVTLELRGAKPLPASD